MQLHKRQLPWARNLVFLLFGTALVLAHSLAGFVIRSSDTLITSPRRRQSCTDPARNRYANRGEAGCYLELVLVGRSACATLLHASDVRCLAVTGVLYQDSTITDRVDVPVTSCLPLVTAEHGIAWRWLSLWWTLEIYSHADLKDNHWQTSTCALASTVLCLPPSSCNHSDWLLDFMTIAV